MHDRRFNPGGGLNLRSPERLAQLEAGRAIRLTLEGTAAKTLLDVGTGSGAFAELFAGQGLAVHGVDVNHGLLLTARQHLPRVPFQAALAEHLPYRDACFDIVFLGLVLHEVDDALQVLREGCRVARMRVAVFEWRDEEQDFGPPRAHRLSAERVASLAGEAGFPGVETLLLRDLVLYRLALKG